MSNNELFKKVAKGKKVSSQQNINGHIHRQKVGRPPKQGVGRYTIRLLKSLHREISIHCEKNGIGISYFIQGVVREKFKELEREKNRSVRLKTISELLN